MARRVEVGGSVGGEGESKDVLATDDKIGSHEQLPLRLRCTVTATTTPVAYTIMILPDRLEVGVWVCV